MPVLNAMALLLPNVTLVFKTALIITGKATTPAMRPVSIASENPTPPICVYIVTYDAQLAMVRLIIAVHVLLQAHGQLT
jgi:hypothetical protein